MRGLFWENNNIFLNVEFQVNYFAVLELKIRFYATFHPWGQAPRSGIVNPNEKGKLLMLFDFRRKKFVSEHKVN